MRHIASWIKESTYDETLSFITELALSHAREGGTEGERIANYITSGDLHSVCDFDLDYSSLSAHQAYSCRQSLAFFGKLECLKLGIDKRKEAFVKFMGTEKTCKEMNELFRAHASGSICFEPRFERIFHLAQIKIARVLGDVPSLSDLKLSYGPGATTLTKKSRASLVEKLQAKPACSKDLIPLVKNLLEEMPHFSEFHSMETDDEGFIVDVAINDGIVDFVPKSAKTLRTIIKEPSLNTMVQAGIRRYMEKRLRAVGVNLKDQTRNQKLALQGSLDGSLATLDLSSASDTISTGLVFELLPFDWACFLDNCRTSSVIVDGKPMQLEKFSSNGNGFTFPLESLIFWAISSSASADNFASVYGDDIIVSTASVNDVIDALTFAGFTINKKKSFWTGPFRESCGADYIRGIDIRPCYIKELISPASLFLLHNYYVRNNDLDRATLVRDAIHPNLRIYGPDGFGDGHLLGEWRRRPHKRRYTHGYGGVIFDTFSLSAKRDRRALRPGDRLLPIYSTYIHENAYQDSLGTLPNKPNDFDYYGLFGRLKRKTPKLAPEPIPERVSQVDGSHVKCVPLPGTSGYHRISIYTLTPD